MPAGLLTLSMFWECSFTIFSRLNIGLSEQGVSSTVHTYTQWINSEQKLCVSVVPADRGG